ncbi:MAG: cyclic nucleotide-binding domain-containing protein, partial [Candidatus Accumulibacter sp.]|nr:cyclic nucleotide-binding domain-containing protein [Accumulibacter sp.]
MADLRTCTAWRDEVDCLACDGRENSFFAGLSPDALATLHVDVDNTATPSGEILYRPGEAAEYLWVLRTGALKLIASSWGGKARIVRILKPGDVAGIEGLLAGRHAHMAVTVGTVRA